MKSDESGMRKGSSFLLRIFTENSISVNSICSSPLWVVGAYFNAEDEFVAPVNSCHFRVPIGRQPFSVYRPSEKSRTSGRARIRFNY